MQERYIKWWTPYLSREFEMLVFGNGGGLPLIIFPTSFGRYHQNKDFGLIDFVAWFVDNNRVTVWAYPGNTATTPRHAHVMDTVVVWTEGRVGHAVFLPAGTAHDAEPNGAGDAATIFELK